MPNAAAMPFVRRQFSDANGDPLAGGLVYTYAAGTTTPLATYTDSSASTPNTNPIQLDSGGFANVFISGASYKFVAQDRFGAVQWTQDGIADSAVNISNSIGTANGLATLDANSFVNQAQLNYNLSQTGSVNRTILSKLSDQVSVKDFGAVGNGTTDDTAAFQAAINYASGKGKGLYLPGGTYLVTNLQVPHNTAMFGQVSAAGAGANGYVTIIQGTAGSDIMSFIDVDGQGFPDGFHFECIQFKGGLNAINWGYASSHAQAGITGFTMRDCSFNGQSACSVTNGVAGRWIERGFFEHVEFNGGQYGWYLQNGTATANTYMEKITFLQCRFGGTVNGLKCDVPSHCEDTNLINCIWNGCGQSALVLLGPCNNWVIQNPAFEVNCYSAPPVLCQTTGNTTAGSPTITVATATGLVVGQQLTVQAAATNGFDWYPIITAIAGTTITVDSNAALTLTGTEVTNAIYDETYLGLPSSGSQAPARINFVTGAYGIQNTGGNKSRYGIYSPNSTPIFFSCQIGRPLYDPNCNATLVATKASNTGSLRVGTNLAANNGSLTFTRDADGRSPIPVIMPGNPGKGVLVTLPGGGANINTGPFGNFSISGGGANRTSLFKVNADTGMVTLEGADASTSAVTNFGIGVNSVQNTNGSKFATYIANGIAPTAQFSSGGIFYVLAGELYYLSSSNVTTQLTGIARYPSVVAQQSLTSQSSAIGSTGLYSAPAGLYKVSVMLDVRTAGSGGTIVLSFAAPNTTPGRGGLGICNDQR
jgi:hypothetical protein